MTDQSESPGVLDRDRIRALKRALPADVRRPTPKVRARHRVEYAAVRCFELLVRALGPDLSSAVCGKLWRLLGPRTKRHGRALDNLARAFPDRSSAERRAIASAMWDNLGRVSAEAFLVDRIVQDRERIRLDSPDVLDCLEAAGGRAVLASLHYANWEIVAWPVTDAGYRTAGVYQRLQNPLIDRYVAALRGTVFPGGMHPKGHGTPQTLMRSVRSGNPVAVLGDHRELRGISVPFLGEPAPSNPLPAFIARALQVPLIAGRAIREGGVRFRVEGEIVPVPITEDREADVAAGTAALQAVYERWIRDQPEQWMWTHSRWERGSPPPGPPPT